MDEPKPCPTCGHIPMKVYSFQVGNAAGAAAQPMVYSLNLTTAATVVQPTVKTYTVKV
jgi:hypothetical protein